MANLADQWTFGVARCEACGYEWDASTENLPRDGIAIKEIVTGEQDFLCPCPQCGQGASLVEIVGV
jgi:rubredoxin